MCLTVEYYETGFCPECRVRSAAYLRNEQMCTPQFYEPESDLVFDTQNCLIGHEKKEIRWQWAEPAREGGLILESHCIRCYREMDWGDFYQRHVTKTTDESWSRNPVPELIDYFQDIPVSLHPDRWFQRALRWAPFMAENLQAPAGEDLRLLKMYPDFAKYILLSMEWMRMLPHDWDWDRFQVDHQFPPWWYNPANPPPWAYPAGVPLSVSISTMEREHWDDRTHANFDFSAWLPLNRRYRTWSGHDDPLIGH